jgi:hypothetical protein
VLPRRVLPIIQVEHRPLFSFNLYVAATYEIDPSLLYVCDCSTKSLATYMPQLPAIPTAMVIVGGDCAVFLVRDSLLVFPFRVGSVSPISPAVRDPVVLRADPSSAFRLLCATADGAVTAFEVLDGHFYTKVILREPGICRLVLSPKYLLTATQSGAVKCYLRTDFGADIVFVQDVSQNAKFFIDDTFYFQQISDRLLRFQIPQLAEDVGSVAITRAFDDCTELVFEPVESRTKLRIGEYTFDLTREFKEVRLVNSVLCVWYDVDAAPVIVRLATDQQLWLGRAKELAKESLGTLAQLSDRTGQAQQKLCKSVDVLKRQTFAKLGDLKGKVDALRGEVDQLERALVDQGIGSRGICLAELARGRAENCFRLAADLPGDDFLAVCAGRRFLQALGEGRLSEPTLLAVARRCVDVIEAASEQVVPILVAALTELDPTSGIVQAAVKAFADELLALTITLFQGITPSSPIYFDLRRLSHVAISFKNM